MYVNILLYIGEMKMIHVTVDIMNYSRDFLDNTSGKSKSSTNVNLLLCQQDSILVKYVFIKC